MQDCSLNFNVFVETHTENMVRVFNRSASWVTSLKIYKAWNTYAFQTTIIVCNATKNRSPLTCVSKSLVNGPHYLGNGD